MSVPFAGPPHRPAPLFTCFRLRAASPGGQAKEDKGGSTGERPAPTAGKCPGSGSSVGTGWRMSAKTDDVVTNDTARLSRGSPSVSSDDEVSELFVHFARGIAQDRAGSVHEAFVALGGGHNR